MLQPYVRWTLVPTRRLSQYTTLRQVPASASIDPKYKNIVGERDVVGFGANGQTIYYDNVMFPYPAIRFKKNEPHLQVLREKEKGDWKKLSIEEKKQLYRASFCQTFAEMQAPTGEYKSAIGFGLIFACLAILGHITLTYFIYGPLPESCSEESQRTQLRRILDLRMNPVTGISSKWDYENDTWKSNK